MKIYVAGAWSTREAIRQFMTELECLGHTITHDWTSYELVYDDEISRNIKCAEADINAVIDADLVIAVMTLDEYPYKGTRHELGSAFTLQQLRGRGVIPNAPDVWVISNGNKVDTPDAVPECMRTCFTMLTDRFFFSTADVLKALDHNVRATEQS